MMPVQCKAFDEFNADIGLDNYGSGLFKLQHVLKL